jgi:hypothetical protein
MAALAWLVLCLVPLHISADAIVRSTAMFADTIAEFYVEKDHVRLELEIGEADIMSFRNLLPDGVYQQLGLDDTPFEDRYRQFITRDFAILANGEPLPGFIEDMGPSTRPLRDDVTGEELPTPEEDAVLVIGATLIFPFEGQPATSLPDTPSTSTGKTPGIRRFHSGR